MIDLSPSELADRLAAVRTYTAKELGLCGFFDPTGLITEDACILVSPTTRDAIIAALRDWK